MTSKTVEWHREPVDSHRGFALGEPQVDIVEKGFAAIVLLFLFVKPPGLSLIPISACIGLVLFPVVLPCLLASSLTRKLLYAVALALGFGAFLRLVLPVKLGRPSSGLVVFAVDAWLISIPVILALGMWALQRLALRTGLVLVSLGMSISAFANAAALARLPGLGNTLSSLEWKGTQGTALTMLALCVAAGKPVVWSRLILLGATIMNLASDARALAFVSACVFACTFMNEPARALANRRPKLTVSAIVAAVPFFGLAAVHAMQSGWLGLQMQQRTLDQTRGGQDVITGGRAEWAATLHLFAVSPQGYGAGVQVDPGLQGTALSAVNAVGGDASADYFRSMVFGERTDLHSMLADMWFHFGVGGLIVCVILAIIFVSALPRALSFVRGLGAAALFIIIVGIWDLLFSPMGNSDRMIFGLLAAMLLLTREHDLEWSKGRRVWRLAHSKTPLAETGAEN